MSRNGSGTQSSPAGSFPVVTGTIIDSTKFNNTINDINSEITKSIANDGQTPILANLPMSGFKHTGAAQANAAGQYVEYAQANSTYLAKASNLSDVANTTTARTNIGAAASGANTDITSLSSSVTGTTQAANDNSTKLATTAYADAAANVASSKIQPVTASVGSNALTLTLNATKLDFRSSTLTSGTVNTRTVSSPISVTVSSGSTLGTSNGVSARLAIIAIDNAGTVELAVTNLAGSANLDESTLISTTAEGGAGAADSANVIYSTTARSSVPFRVVGYVDISEATAGTWASAPTVIQGAGGYAQVQRIVSSATVASTSGTSIDFTGIPSWVKRITVMFNGVSTNGSSQRQVQLGAGSVTTSGYSGGYGGGGAAAWNGASLATGIAFGSVTAAADVYSGIMTICNMGGNLWAAGFYGGSSASNFAGISGGSITLSGILDRIRITTANGTDAFDAGSINIMYE
jgi:hypothetical protein